MLHEAFTVMYTDKKTNVYLVLDVVYLRSAKTLPYLDHSQSTPRPCPDGATEPHDMATAATTSIQELEEHLDRVAVLSDRLHALVLNA
ncbi:hypothetical protein J8273_5592 [Carpediemonas membranifera]|uniref:Uncharacterized protein n=1 Tax=Carpediemonas membranifera TaxID=201153 RepID=A0A8J6B9W7_9EUKA|nr:hypothetical protein J8273_5592 [Carpediemonas membranifera]|eukprot:KAG9392997.1 hypothetical protein J8273_5592 [Carpediemonas membranifera]